jgi:protein-tyrosine-phosphatase
MTKVLFVCVENSCRSQMAEAFARIHGGGKIKPYSSGSRPSGKINPKAIEAMKEIGYDLSIHTSKSLNEVPKEQYDYVITMGCGDACPLVPARHREDWAIPDPKGLPDEEFRKIRDLIETKVIAFIASLL